MKYLENTASSGLSNGATGVWNTVVTNNLNLAVMPSMSTNSNRNIVVNLTNALAIPNNNLGSANFQPLANLLAEQSNQSIDGSGFEPIVNPSANSAVAGAPMCVTNTTYLGSTGSGNSLTNDYTSNVDVWLPPGAVLYTYTPSTATTPSAVYVSDYTNPTKHINIKLQVTASQGSRAELVMPGYLVDGIFFVGLDMGFSFPVDPAWPRYRSNNSRRRSCGTTTRSPPRSKMPSTRTIIPRPRCSVSSCIATTRTCSPASTFSGR